MDETGLFWKLTPERTLATEAGSGGKKSKDRVTLAFTSMALAIKMDVLGNWPIKEPYDALKY